MFSWTMQDQHLKSVCILEIKFIMHCMEMPYATGRAYFLILFGFHTPVVVFLFLFKRFPENLCCISLGKTKDTSVQLNLHLYNA